MIMMITMKREQITLLCGFLRWSEFMMIIDIDNYDSDDGDKRFGSKWWERNDDIFCRNTGTRTEKSAAVTVSGGCSGIEMSLLGEQLGRGLDGWWWWCRFWWGWGLFVTFRWGFWGFWWVKRLMVIGHDLLSVSYLCLHSVSVSQWRFQCLMKVWIRMRILIRIRIITKTLMKMWVGDIILTQENNQDECCNVKRCNTM